MEYRRYIWMYEDEQDHNRHVLEFQRQDRHVLDFRNQDRHVLDFRQIEKEPFIKAFHMFNFLAKKYKAENNQKGLERLKFDLITLAYIYGFTKTFYR